jgi:hypothetical protein
VLEQIKRDSELLDEQAIPIGPFARLDANAVAAHDGKTRGAITNLFGSQAAFQAETMALVLSVGDWIELIEYPSPEDFPDAAAWVAAFFGGESERGPQHGGEPVVGYAMLWTLWLSTVPYGLWSEHVQGPSMDEHRQWVARLEREFAHALEHFGVELREGTTLNDLAGAGAYTAIAAACTTSTVASGAGTRRGDGSPAGSSSAGGTARRSCSPGGSPSSSSSTRRPRSPPATARARCAGARTTTASTSCGRG